MISYRDENGEPANVSRMNLNHDRSDDDDRSIQTGIVLPHDPIKKGNSILLIISIIVIISMWKAPLDLPSRGERGFQVFLRLPVPSFRIVPCQTMRLC
jgi:hypothetical protein